MNKALARARAHRNAIGLGAVVIGTVAWWVPFLWGPKSFVFDEIFYGNDAIALVRHGSPITEVVHPYGAIQLIAVGVRVFGANPVGLRVVPLLAGLTVVALVTFVAFRLTASPPAAGAAAFMTATEPLVLIGARFALLDGLAVAALVALVAACVALPPPVARTRTGAVFIGGLCGFAVSMKWSVVPAVVVVGVTWLRARHLDDAEGSRFRTARRTLLVLIAGALLYLVPHAAWFQPGDHCVESTCSAGPIDGAVAFARDQWSDVLYHRDLEPRGSGVGPTWQWIVQAHGSTMYESGCVAASGREVDHCRRAITARGNPALWLLGTLALAAQLIAIVRRRSIADGLCYPIAAGAALWLGALVAPRPLYAFVAIPIVPFLAISLTALSFTALRHRTALFLSLTVGAVGSILTLAGQRPA